MPPRKRAPAQRTRRKAVPYADAAALVAPLTERIRQLEAANRAALRDVDAARTIAGASWDQLTQHVGALRRLVLVLTDNACDSGRPRKLHDVVLEVQQLLAGEDVPH